MTGIAYDTNGNIMSLNRRGVITSSNGIDMDILIYGYDGGNKLMDVTDSGNTGIGFVGSNPGNDYAYDVNGNMITDLNKGISAISYNYLNLPKLVTFGNGNISYIYDATGVKLSKKVVETGKSDTYTYYAGNYVYKNSSLKFFNHPEGYVDAENGFGYVYQYKDHLGNIRLSYKDVSLSSTPSLEIQEENNYYPFGLEHKGYNKGNVASTNIALKRKFGGKEYQDELDLEWYDIMARNYDPALGRWMNIDLLAEKMRKHSPYNYAFDNPIYFIDYDGMQPEGCCNVFQRLGRAIRETLVESHAKNMNQIKSFFSKGENNSLVGNDNQTAKGGMQFFVSKELQKDGIATPSKPMQGADITSGDGDGLSILAETRPSSDFRAGKVADIAIGAAELISSSVNTINQISISNSEKSSINFSNTTDNFSNETTTISIRNPFRITPKLGNNLPGVISSTKDTVVFTSDVKKVQDNKAALNKKFQDEADKRGNN